MPPITRNKQIEEEQKQKAKAKRIRKTGGGTKKPERKQKTKENQIKVNMGNLPEQPCFAYMEKEQRILALEEDLKKYNSTRTQKILTLN